MSKEKSETLASLVYDYLEELEIPDVRVDIVGGNTHSMSVAITVPDGYKDEVDEIELLHRVSKVGSLDDVEVSFSCYTEVELQDALEGADADPDDGVGDDDPDEEDEVKADKLTLKENIEGEELEGDYEEEDPDDGETDDDGLDDYEDVYEPEAVDEYQPTLEDIRAFGGFHDDD